MPRVRHAPCLSRLTEDVGAATGRPWLAPPSYATLRRRLPTEVPCRDATPIKVLATSSADRVACLKEIRYATK